MVMYLKMSTTLLTLLTLLLSGCSRNGAYRSDLDVCSTDLPSPSMEACPTSAFIHHAQNKEDEYYLGFVEFDDQGQMWQRGQLENMIEKFYEIAAKEDVLIVTFVHGWHHNAAPDDENVKRFEKLLGDIAKTELQSSKRNGSEARKVLGLYIGWRGESIEMPYVDNLTFWERKNTAENVGLTGVTEVLLKLEEIVNVKAGVDQSVPKPLNSRLVVIGHSFGGAVVFSAMQQVLSDRFIDSRRGKTSNSDAQGYGDLVILLNPAFEAMRYATLYDISQYHCRDYFPTQLPRLAILTSESDYATRFAFPIGRAFSTFFETHSTLTRHYCKDGQPVSMSIAEGKADRSAVGHFEPYLTHQLNASHEEMRSVGMPDPTRLQTRWSTQQEGGVLAFQGSSLKHLNRTHPLNPYLNIKVDAALISDHNDIWGEEVVSFLRDLIAISTFPAETAVLETQ